MGKYSKKRSRMYATDELLLDEEIQELFSEKKARKNPQKKPGRPNGWQRGSNRQCRSR